MTVFEARHAAQGGTTTTARTGTSAAPQQQDNQNQQPRQEGNTGWPAARWQNEGRHLPPVGDRRSGVRHGLSVPTGKPADMAASGHPCGALRPGQNAPGRQVGRPLSPARVRAMPERFVVIERPKNRFIRKKAGPAPRTKRATAARRGRKARF